MQQFDWSARLLALTEAPEIDCPAVMAHLPSRSKRAAMKSAFLHCWNRTADLGARYRAEQWLAAHEPMTLKRERRLKRMTGTPKVARHGG